MLTKRELLRSAALTAAAIATTKSVPAFAQTGVTPAEARALAKEAYIWGYPLVDTYRIQYDYFVDKTHPEFKGDWNKLTHNSRLYTPDDKTIQTINSDTLYSFIGADLRDEPIVITVPAVEPGALLRGQHLRPLGPLRHYRHPHDGHRSRELHDRRAEAGRARRRRASRRSSPWRPRWQRRLPHPAFQSRRHRKRQESAGRIQGANALGVPRPAGSQSRRRSISSSP